LLQHDLDLAGLDAHAAPLDLPIPSPEKFQPPSGGVRQVTGAIEGGLARVSGWG
jgi:hypothetical protein